MDHEHLLLELGKLFWRDCGVGWTGLHLGFAPASLARRAAHEVLNPMPGETRGPQSIVRRNTNSKTAYFLYPIRVNPQYEGDPLL